MIYTAGLNTGSPEKASANFLVFAFVMGWSALISLLPFWTPVPPPPVNENQETGELAEQGLRMGIGTALALAISYFAGFAKIGWAPSAVGNVVRYDEKLSRKRAWARFFGTLGGAAMAAIALAFVTDPTIVVLIGAVFAVLNGLFKLTPLGRMPLFYTATILLLYTANDLTIRQRERADPGGLQRCRHHHRSPGRHLPVPTDDEDAQSQDHGRIALGDPAMTTNDPPSSAGPLIEQVWRPEPGIEACTSRVGPLIEECGWPEPGGEAPRRLLSAQVSSPPLDVRRAEQLRRILQAAVEAPSPTRSRARCSRRSTDAPDRRRPVLRRSRGRRVGVSLGRSSSAIRRSGDPVTGHATSAAWVPGWRRR